jgi:hypothetical protein
MQRRESRVATHDAVKKRTVLLLDYSFRFAAVDADQNEAAASEGWMMGPYNVLIRGAALVERGVAI